MYGGNSNTCHTYVVTIGNGAGTKNVLKWKRALGFVFSIQSSVYGATTAAKVSLFSTWTRSTVSFTLCKRRNQPIAVNIGNTQTNFLYLHRPCKC